MTTLYMRDEQGLIESAPIVNGDVDAKAAPQLAYMVQWAKSGGFTADDLDGQWNGYYLISTSPDTPWPGGD